FQFDAELNLFVVDINGKIVFTEQILNQQQSIDLTSIHSGMYFLIFESEGRLNSEKIVLN
ncbi:MAG: T9SS type A sorting domain-containing protein, partial [Bacteroidota bacterium]